jgi:hypothetical protein
MLKHADEFSLSMQSSLSPDGTVLCKSCGMCCTGAIYPRAGLQSNETGLAKSLEFTITTIENQLYFCMPCPQYRHNLCAVYAATRPAVCVAFQCNLLKKFLSNQITIEQGILIVNRAKELWTQVTRLLPPDYPFFRFRLLFEQAAEAKAGLNHLPALLRQNYSLLRAVFQLEWYLLRHFHLARKEGHDSSLFPADM